MRRIDRTRVPIIVSLAVGALGLSIQSCHGSTEYCILCQNPDVSYRCVLDVPGSASAGAALQCIKQLAKSGGHQSCSVRRGDGAQIEGGCEGDVVLVTPDPNSLQAAPNERPPIPPGEQGHVGVLPSEEPHPIEQALPATPAEEPLQEVEPNGEAKTVEELARRTAKSTQEGIKSAGDAVVDTAKNTGKQIQNAGEFVGGAAKKTWDCVTSLFSDC